MKGEGTAESGQPVVILGGFMSSDQVYRGLRGRLAHLSKEPVHLVATRSYQWATVAAPPGWLYLLGKLDQTVRRAVVASATGKVTLVGHSAGGLLARMYLSPEPLLGKAYAGLERVSHLITLGSPHYNQRRWLHGGLMSRWLESHYPGAFYAPGVKYTAVAGRSLRGDPSGSLPERHAYRFYRHLTGDGEEWGDGLVPVSSALLSGADEVVLDGVGHFAGFGAQWYGSEQVVAAWWQAAQANGDASVRTNL
jgi:pimeloyl-ACP methyl ester carboxylesterase